MTEEEYVDWKELEKYLNEASTKNTKKYKGIIDVINRTIIVKDAEFIKETTQWGDKEMMIMHTDNGDVKTASTVLIKQMRALQPKIGGRPFKTVIKAVKKGANTYYTFDHP